MRRRLIWVVLGAALAGALDGFPVGYQIMLRDDDRWISPTEGGVICAVLGAAIGLAAGGILAGLLTALARGWRRR
jgi:hypothetical protein